MPATYKERGILPYRHRLIKVFRISTSNGFKRERYFSLITNVDINISLLDIYP